MDALLAKNVLFFAVAMNKLNTATDPQVGYRPPGTLDPSTALDHYAGPFGVRQAAHLARRTGFGATQDDIATLQPLGMQGAVNARIHPGQPEVELPSFPSAATLYDMKLRYHATQMWWYDRLLRSNHPFSQKMAVFWHGHFATSMRKVPPALMAAQINLFTAQGLGNFRTLLLEVARGPAMLVWLDNRSNYKAHPNENFAREVMELFALGLGNYTEDDVKAAARAFTGWTLDKNSQFVVR
ncbi:MAG: DUF1800 domain-containing protein, partial [Candidatus Eremiobacteraeota bacterium]|nr:DUF1800 domain-containing protein [Candidatus Eremiobacteraeota bacterium]